MDDQEEETMTRTMINVVGVAATAAALAVGCSHTMPASPAGGSAMAAPMTSMPGGKAAGLRAGLNTLLQEHVYLAAAATGAALDGRDAEFKAAAGARSCRCGGGTSGLPSTTPSAWRRAIGRRRTRPSATSSATPRTSAPSWP